MNNRGYISSFEILDWQEVAGSIYLKNETDVQRALSKENIDLEDFKALISPAAEPYLEQMAKKAKTLTEQRFGKAIRMYIPLYLSNECQNICTYCGFSLDIKIARKTLTDEEIHREAQLIKSKGYDHVLVVTGEANKTVGLPYFLNAIKILKSYFSQISLEVQPLEEEEYATLHAAGVYGILVYQETYKEEDYKLHHPKGKKSNFSYRLNTPDRIGKAGMHKIGLGVLYGLEDWRVDTFFCAHHLKYLEKVYWRSTFAVSFPRLRPCANGIPLKSNLSNRQLTQVICAYRMLNPELELSLSTRESASFRDGILGIGITSISADSKTDPGGYGNPQENLEQFEIDDKRSTSDFINAMKARGFDPIFKDWEPHFGKESKENKHPKLSAI